mmetsp:Transcript_62016/g.148318  ORF Transcript_62016/g.148318 Transcript_62016/m.148318 type:complete len:223 (+) Transcript_62016:354-1022(+)
MCSQKCASPGISAGSEKCPTCTSSAAAVLSALGSEASRTRRPLGSVSARYFRRSSADVSTVPSGSTTFFPGATLYPVAYPSGSDSAAVAGSACPRNLDPGTVTEAATMDAARAARSAERRETTMSSALLFVASEGPPPSAIMPTEEGESERGARRRGAGLVENAGTFTNAAASSAARIVSIARSTLMPRLKRCAEETMMRGGQVPRIPPSHANVRGFLFLGG